MVASKVCLKLVAIFNLKDKKLFSKLLLSFIVIGILPVLIIGSITYTRLFNTLRQHIISSNIAYMDQNKNYLDSYLRQIHNMMAQLSGNTKVNSFFLEKNLSRVDILFHIKDIITEINKYGVASHEITDVKAIYFPENKVVITNKTYYEGDSFYTEFRKYINTSAEEWLKKLDEASPRIYWEAQTVVDSNNMQKRVITCVQALPMYSKKHAYLITMIDEGKLWNLLAKNNNEGWENFQGIIDESGKMITCSDPDNVPAVVEKILNSKFPGASGYIDMKDTQGDRYIVTYTLSGENKWKYFGIIPEKMILQRLSSTTMLCLGTLAVATLFAIALSWYLSQRNYKPVKDIVHLIRSKANRQHFQESGELNIIRNTVSQMFELTKEMEEKLESHVSIARTHFLLRLLKGMTDMDKIRNSIKLYSFDLPYTHFIVAVMELKNSNSVYRQGQSQNHSNIAMFAASSIIENTLNEKFRVYHVEIDEYRIALLINTNLAHDEGKSKSDVENELRKMIALLEIKSGANVVIGIGREYLALEHVNKSYDEALAALDYIMVRGSYQIMHYERMKTTRNNIFYPLAKEQQLLNQVKLGDFDAAEATLDEIYKANFIEREISVKLAQCLLNNLISSLLKILDELSLDFSAFFESDSKLVYVMNNTGSVEEVFSNIKNNLRKICEIITEKKNSHNTRLRDRIIEHINTSYSDRNLSLTSVADKFNLTTPYLSRFFKEQTGYNFNDYLNQCRTKNAKALLSESGFTIAEIAERIGYNSPGTFIRIFKRYESVTPGQYRESFSNMEV